jgi:L-alanine-DL-glutamate epimerase-like enolase superfamily enzyme
MLQTQVLRAQVEFLDQPFIKPLQLSSGTCREITEARAFVEVSVDGSTGSGIGSIYLSDVWSWPHGGLTHHEKDLQMRALCMEIAAKLPGWAQPAAHPLELGLQLHDRVCHAGDRGPFPVLARAVCLSPFDAAIHDAVGHALGRSAFSFYDESVSLPRADRFFKGANATELIRRTLKPPKTALDAWWVIGAGEEIATSFGTAVREGGYRGYKIRLQGKRVSEDVARIITVFDSVRDLGVAEPRLSLDANEAYAGVDQPFELLTCLRSERPDVFGAVTYLEQPTHRDITGNAYSWKKVSALKPVLLDEGLTDLALLPLAEAQGWSGLALKTCKGHSFTLVAAAWARERGIPVAMQDLTNPGYAAIHSFLTAAHLETINGVELNSPQYTPAANSDWLPRLAGLFQIKNGKHHLDGGNFIGLGSDL